MKIDAEYEMEIMVPITIKVIVEDAGEHGVFWIGQAKGISGAISQAGSEEELKEHMQDAISLMLYVNEREHNEKIQARRKREAAKTNS
jgi:predicted RNase H-like HicB family nuclease